MTIREHFTNSTTSASKVLDKSEIIQRSFKSCLPEIRVSEELRVSEEQLIARYSTGLNN